MEEITFKTSVDTGTTVKDINAINKELKKTDDATKTIGTDISARFEALNKKVESGTLTMRESAKAVKEYQTIALQAGRESAVGKEAIANAAELSDKLADLKQEIANTAHDGRNMQGALQIGSAVTAGYGAMQGVMALTGMESEGLVKTMVKLQAVQSVLAGIEQIRATLEKQSSAMRLIKIVQTKLMTAGEIIYAAAVGGTTGAMQVLRITMLALPIVAIIAGIVALVAALASFGSETESAKESSESLNRALDRQKALLQEVASNSKRDNDQELKMMEILGKSAKEQHEKKLDNMAIEQMYRKIAISDEQNAIRGNTIEYKKALAAEEWELAKSLKEKIDASRSAHKELFNAQKDYFNDVKNTNAQFKEDEGKKSDEDKAKEAEKQKKYAEDAKKRREEEAKKKLELAQLTQDLVIANIDNENERAIAAMNLQQVREQEQLRAKFGKNAELEMQLREKQQTELLALIDAQEKADQAKQDELDKEATDKAKEQQAKLNADAKASLEAKIIDNIATTEDGFKREQELKAELALLDMEQALLNVDLTEGEKLKIKAEYNEKIRTLDEETAQHEKELREKAIQDGLDWASKGIQGLTDLSSAYFDTKLSHVEKGSKAEEQLQRKQFQMNKAMQLGGAVIDGAKAVMASLASSPVAIGAVPNPAGIASLAFVAASSVASIAKIAATRFEGGASSSGGANGVTPPNISTSGGDGTSTLTGGLNGANTQTTPQQTQVVLVDSVVKAGLDSQTQVAMISKVG